jgi:hypothetical protein
MDFNDNYTMCININNKTSGGGEQDKENNNDYLLWVFIIIIGMALIILTICIFKKICFNKSSSIYEEISSELEEKELIN